MPPRTGPTRVSRHKAGATSCRPTLAPRKEEPGATCLLRVEGSTLVIDTRDSDILVDAQVAVADFYAKRSFRPGGYDITGTTVIPYGVNYAVYAASVDLHVLRRVGLPGSGRRIGEVARALALDRVITVPMTPRMSNIRPRPMVVGGDGPQVIFLTRVWPPLDPDRPEASSDRDELNEQRVACIRALRKEFGPQFIGGLTRDPHSERYFADCLASNDQTEKQPYIRLAGSVPIGVTTTGLGASTGWKFAEYVAMGRAIVTERLQHEVPGPLAPETNYVTFDTPDGCVEACRRLLDDPGRVAEMSRANVTYYEEYVRPDRLVGNVLRRVAPGRI